VVLVDDLFARLLALVPHLLEELEGPLDVGLVGRVELLDRLRIEADEQAPVVVLVEDLELVLGDEDLLPGFFAARGAGEAVRLLDDHHVRARRARVRHREERAERTGEAQSGPAADGSAEHGTFPCPGKPERNPGTVRFMRRTFHTATDNRKVMPHCAYPQVGAGLNQGADSSIVLFQRQQKFHVAPRIANSCFDTDWVMDRLRIVALVGATASGKARLALDAAKEVGAEILSCDSMKVYREMDVGTAKPGPAARAAVRWHALDLVEPHERFDATSWTELALTALQDARERRV